MKSIGVVLFLILIVPSGVFGKVADVVSEDQNGNDSLAPIVTLEGRTDAEIKSDCAEKTVFCIDPDVWSLNIKIENPKNLSLGGIINWGRGENDTTPFVWKGKNFKIPLPYRANDIGEFTATVALKTIDAKGGEHSAAPVTRKITVVRKAGNTEGFVVTVPKVGEKWRAGVTKILRWQKEKFASKNNISIFLHAKDSTETLLFNALQNTGAKAWKVQKTIAPGSYTIRIVCIAQNGGEQCGEGKSGQFEILAPSLGSSLLDAFFSFFREKE